MSFLFKTDAIFYNAFYAVQDKTSFLSYDDTLVFCALLNRKIKEAFEEQNLCCNAIFDLNTSDDKFFNSSQNEFLRVNDGYLYYGDTKALKEKIRLVNSRYEETGLVEILKSAQKEYLELLEAKDEPKLKGLQEESWRLTVV